MDKGKLFYLVFWGDICGCLEFYSDSDIKDEAGVKLLEMELKKAARFIGKSEVEYSYVITKSRIRAWLLEWLNT